LSTRPGLPATQDGIGTTLVYSSSNTVQITSTDDNKLFEVSIPDYTIEAYNKYFIGITYTTSLVSGANNIVVKSNGAVQNLLTTQPIFLRSTATTPTIDQVRGGHRYSPINWGYDSGNGVTEWYNPNPGGYNYSVIATNTTTNIVGLTFTMNTDFEGIYVESIRIGVRNPSSTFPTGTGATYHCILYDSDGITALVGHTISAYPHTNSTPVSPIVLPVQSWLKNKKVYHFAFPCLSSVDANNQIAYSPMPYSWQRSGQGFTSIYFTKNTGSGSPVYDSDRIIPFHLLITDIRGNLQNSSGKINVF
jgi:hypothetical protein